MPKVFTQESGNPVNHPKTELTVPAGYKIIGGGAEVFIPGQNMPHSLLTASHPKNNRTWFAEAKDHGYARFSKVRISVIAIYDPHDVWDVRVFQETGDRAFHPTATVSVEKGYLLTGGGAKNNWSGPGNLLTGSYPIHLNTWSWTAKGQDHSASAASTITAYAIGIKPQKECKTKFEVGLFTAESGESQYPHAEIGVDQGWILTGGGANVLRDHNLLIGSYLSGKNKWTARSKDHNGVPMRAKIKVYAIGIREKKVDF